MRSFRRAALGAALVVLAALGASLTAQTVQAPPPPPATKVAAPAKPITDPYGAARPEARTVIAAAQGLMASGQWKKAWDSLAAFDVNETDAYILALKIQICLKGYVQTDAHLAFALVDLAAGETVQALREAGDRGALMAFDPFGAVQGINAVNPDLPPVLHLALGDYCYDVQAIYADKWQATEEEVCSVGLSSYEEAQQGGLATADSLRKQGELLLRFSRNEEAEASIRASLALEPANLGTKKSLAVALAQANKLSESLALMDEVVAATKAKDDRYGLLMTAARIASMDGMARAETYIQAAEKEFPGEPGPALVRHMIALQTQGPAEAGQAADRAFDLFPDSPYVVRSLLTTWLNADKTDEALAFLDRNLVRQAKDASLAILGFYKALLIAQSQGPAGFAEARAVLDTAETRFKAAFPPGDQVFEAIAQLREELSAPQAEVAPPGAAAPAAPATPAKP